MRTIGISLGAPTKIEAMSSIDHELFRVLEKAGHVITFNSNLSRAQCESPMAHTIVTGTLAYLFLLNAAAEAAQ